MSESDDFNVDFWINDNLKFDDDSIESYEEAVCRMLTKIQMNSRSVSQETEQIIKNIVAELPDAITELQKIGGNVNGINEQLRKLTNYGYKFKTGNISEKVSTLSGLKEKRDRLREASNMLKNGIEIEKELIELKEGAGTEDISKICLKFNKVEKAANDLADVNKFGKINDELDGIQKILINRIKPEIENACIKMNDDALIKVIDLTKLIDSDFLINQVALESYENKIKKIIDDFNDGQLDICDWLKPCLNQCGNYAIKYIKWCLGIKPPFFQNVLKYDLIKILSNILSSAIEQKMKIFLRSYLFDELVNIFNMIYDFINSFPSSWKITKEMFLFNVLTNIQSQFSSVLQSYFISLFNDQGKRQIRKSKTTDNMNKLSTQPNHGSVDNIQLLDKPQQFKKEKLKDLILICEKSLKWINILAKNQIDCFKLVIDSLKQAIKNATEEINLSFSYKERNIDSNDKSLSLLNECFQLYVYEENLGKRLFSFQENLNKISELQDDLDGLSMDQLKAMIEDHIIKLSSYQAFNYIHELHKSEIWNLPESDEPISTSSYIINIGKTFLDFSGQLSEIQEITQQVMNNWFIRNANNVLSEYAKEILLIPKISVQGQKILTKDITYIQDLLKVFSIEALKFHQDLIDILKVLTATKDQKQTVLSEVSQNVYRSLSVSISN